MKIINYQKIKENGLNKNMVNELKSCKIIIRYDKALFKITHKKFEECVISEGLIFVMFLSFVFSSYPEMEKQFPAGKLAFTLNGQKPMEFNTLHNNDTISFFVPKL